jgi:hypothetical protein
MKKSKEAGFIAHQLLLGVNIETRGFTTSLFLQNRESPRICTTKTKHRSGMRGNYHLVYFCGSYRA